MNTVIKITGKQGVGKGVSANALYQAHVQAGKHVAIFDEDLLTQNSKPGIDPKTADIIIVCEHAPTDLKITTISEQSQP